jgi:hypothetical protein
MVFLEVANISSAVCALRSKTISATTTPAARNRHHLLPWRLELLLSIYCSCLFGWVEESRGFALSTQGRYLYLWNPNAVRLGRSDIAIFYIELVFVPAAVVLVFLRFARLSPCTQVLGRAFAGAVAVAGFPLACLFCFYREHLHLFPGSAELATAMIGFFLWVRHRWLVWAPIRLLLLILHYVFWSLAFFSFFSGGLGIRYLSGHWGIWEYALFLVPTLGFCYSVAWAVFFRQIEETQASPEN